MTHAFDREPGGWRFKPGLCPSAGALSADDPARPLTLERVSARCQVVPLAPRHLPGVVRVFSQSFPNTLPSTLGPGLIGEILAAYGYLPGALGLVCLDGEEVAGFVVGSEDSAQYRRALLRRRWAHLLRQALWRLLTSPQSVKPLARYLSFRLLASRPRAGSRRKEADAIPPASLTFVAVAAEYRRRGVADRLTRDFLHEMASRGIDRVKLAVAARNEAALALYTKQGWRMAGSYRTSEGSLAYRLIYDVAPLRKLNGRVA